VEDLLDNMPRPNPHSARPPRNGAEQVVRQLLDIYRAPQPGADGSGARHVVLADNNN
jgi:hypothetical protein